MNGAYLLPVTGILVLSALLGSIPFGVLIARAAAGIDLRRVGSGNIGATNVLRALGPPAAIATLLLDAGKGAAAVLIAQGAGGPGAADDASGAAGLLHGPAVDGLAGLAAVVGHIFSPWMGFRGGKGVATATGVVLALSLPLAGIGLIAFVLVIALTRIVSLASVAAALAVMIAAIVMSSVAVPALPPHALGALVPICVLVLVRHASNLARIVRREEPSIGARKGSKDLRR